MGCRISGTNTVVGIQIDVTDTVKLMFTGMRFVRCKVMVDSESEWPLFADCVFTRCEVQGPHRAFMHCYLDECTTDIK